MDIILIINPQNIRNVGISLYINKPNINAAIGSAPDIKIEDIPESIYFKLHVVRIYGSANENMACMIKNMIVNGGLIEMKPVI